MKVFAPDYYRDFACIKGDCRHSCCIGWEIDIDDDALSFYRSIGGEIGDRLRKNISEEDCPHFILGKNERCPFLNAEGLCDLIIALGEDALCQICADHPRFRNYYSDREEIGLGLCCEAAAALILSRKQPVTLEMISDDGIEEEAFEDESELLSLRCELLAAVQNRNLPIQERIRKMLSGVGIELGCIDFSHWKGFLAQLERLDDAWLDRLNLLDGSSSADTIPAEMEIPLEQLMVYLLFRHINADDDDLSGRIAFCGLIWHLLCAMLKSASLSELTELARLYSSEIEYSDENTGAIIDELHRLYPQI